MLEFAMRSDQNNGARIEAAGINQEALPENQQQIRKPAAKARSLMNAPQSAAE
jgi:hypothetical protein